MGYERMFQKVADIPKKDSEDKIKKTMCHHTLKGVVCKGTCFQDAPKLKAVSYDPILKNVVLISDIIELAIRATDFFFNPEYHIVQGQLGQNGCQQKYN